MRKIPFLGPCLALAAGIEMAGHGEEWLIATVAAAVALSLLAIILTASKNAKWHEAKQTAYSIAILLAFAATGIIAKETREERTRLTDDGPEGVYELITESMPTEKTKSYGIEARIESYASDSLTPRQSGGKVIVYLPKTDAAKNLRIGDTLLYSGKFTIPTPQYPAEFDYGKYLRHKGIGGTGYAHDSTHFAVAGKNKSFSIRQTAWDCREKLIETYKRYGLEGEELAIVSALTLGYRQDLTDETRQSYSVAGVMHLLAVSGLHVGIVFAILAFMLGFFGNQKTQKRVKWLIITIAIWAYAFITGLSPSVTRASFMLTVILVGYIIERKPVMLNTLFLSAFFLLLFNPDNLYDIGFELSYSAVLGIFMFYTPISSVLSKREGWQGLEWRHNPLKKSELWAWNLAAVSVSAQVATLPLTLYYFHKFSIYFLIANYVAIPLATLTIWTAAVLLMFSWLPAIAGLTGAALSHVVHLQNWVIDGIGNLPHSIARTWVTETDVVLIMAVVALIWVAVKRKNLWYMTASAAVLLSLIVIRTARHYEMSKEQMVMVYSQRGKQRKNLTVEYIDGFSHRLYTTDEAAIVGHLDEWWLQRNLREPQVEKLNGKIRVEQCGKTRVAILPNGVNLRSKTAEDRMKVDVIVIGGGAKVYYEDLTRLFDFKEIVLSASVSRKMTAKVKEMAERDGRKVWSVYEEGTYLIKN